MTEPPEEPKPRPQSAAAKVQSETFSGGFVVPPRTCANCGRKFPSVMHLLMHDAAGCKKRRARPATPPPPPRADATRAGAGAAPRRRRSTAASRGGLPARARRRRRRGRRRRRRRVVAHEAPWEASPPPKRVPDPGKRVPPKRAPPPPRRPTGFTFEGPRRRDPPKRPPPPLPEPSPRPASSPKTLYDVLGASQYASAGELRKRYRALSLAHHPDRGGDTTAMMKINSAWDVLGDAATRRRYDASLPD